MADKSKMGSVTSDSHHCVICETEIPCDSPEDPQDCLVSAITCGTCDDAGQAGDNWDIFEAANEQEDERDEPFPDETAKARPQASDDDFFDALLREEDRRANDTFGAPQVKPRDAGTSTFKTPAKRKKGRQGNR